MAKNKPNSSFLHTIRFLKILSNRTVPGVTNKMDYNVPIQVVPPKPKIEPAVVTPQYCKPYACT